jgi:hypothetical protein
MNLREMVMSVAVGSLLVSSSLFAQEPQATKPAAVVENGGGTKVVKTILCQGVKDRDPQDETAAAKVGDVLVGWMQINAAEDTTLTHRWIREGETISDVSLTIKKSPSYRAWSRKTIGSAGKWTWQILDANGTVLKEVTFSVTS